MIYGVTRTSRGVHWLRRMYLDFVHYCGMHLRTYKLVCFPSRPFDALWPRRGQVEESTRRKCEYSAVFLEAEQTGLDSLFLLRNSKADTIRGDDGRMEEDE